MTYIAPKQLSHKARVVIEDADRYSEILVSAISLWEFCKRLEKKRIGISKERLIRDYPHVRTVW